MESPLRHTLHSPYPCHWQSSQVGIADSSSARHGNEAYLRISVRNSSQDMFLKPRDGREHQYRPSGLGADESRPIIGETQVEMPSGPPGRYGRCSLRIPPAQSRQFWTGQALRSVVCAASFAGQYTMTKETKLGGTFTVPNTSLSLYRMGFKEPMGLTGVLPYLFFQPQMRRPVPDSTAFSGAHQVL